jgi:hypothetical protein
MRTIGIVALALSLVACKDAKSKLEEGAQKVDKAIDKLSVDDVKQHLQNAKDALAKGVDALEDCSWAERTSENEAIKASLDELKKVCNYDQPLARATRAVVRAEKAKAEQPEAPSYTECSDDDWAKMKQQLDASHADDAKWTALKGRWTKVCP